MKTILVPVDFSDVTPKVVETARQFAAAFEARLFLVNVAEAEPDFVGFEAGPPAVRAAVARDFKVERQRLDDIKTKLTASGCEVTALHVQGPIVEKIDLRSPRRQRDPRRDQGRPLPGGRHSGEPLITRPVVVAHRKPFSRG